MANPQKIKAKVKEIIAYGHQVYKLIFETEKRFPRFKAGQFLHLTLDDFDPTTGYWPESRVFSIAGCSEDKKIMSIVYSVKGTYTSRMEMELSPDKEVWLKAPYGEFIIPNFLGKGESIVLVAGGTGISPFVPFLREVQNEDNIYLFYGIKNRDVFIFNEELQAASISKKLDISIFFEENENESFFDFKINKGVLNIPYILEKVKDQQEKIFFISGPPVMIDLFKMQLMNSGIKKSKIIIDEWG